MKNEKEAYEVFDLVYVAARPGGKNTQCRCFFSEVPCSVG